jgi:hypothetical protein
MGKSFYLAKSFGQLRSGSQTFSDLINASAESFGLSSLQAESYRELNDDYALKYLLALAPQTRTKGTMCARDDAKRLLVARASELAKIIDAMPVTDGQRANLGLSVRATSSPARVPGTCSNFKAELLNDGSIQLTWRANNSTGMTGVTYQVWRRFGSVGEFAYLGASGEKKFIDSTIPAGMSQVQYQVRGIRPSAAGEWAQFNVNFGRADIAPSASAASVGGVATPTTLAA